MEKLREQYEKEVIPALMKKFEYKSVMQVPKLDKIVINIGLGDVKENPKSLENAMNDLKCVEWFGCCCLDSASGLELQRNHTQIQFWKHAKHLCSSTTKVI